MLLFQLARRNLWRNKSRTLLNLSAFGLAVALSILIRSQQTGSHRYIVRNSLGNHLAYLQLHHKNYREAPNLRNTFAQNPDLERFLLTQPSVKGISPRLLAYGLLEKDSQSKSVQLVGWVPYRERTGNRVADDLPKDASYDSIFIAEGVAEALTLGPEDTLCLRLSTLQGLEIKKRYTAWQLIKVPQPTLNRALVYLPLSELQEMVGLPGQISTYHLSLDQPEKAAWVKHNLRERRLPEAYQLSTWEEMMPELAQLIRADEMAGGIIRFILFVVVGFGLLSSILLTTWERRYEFGMLIGIGMRRAYLGQLLGLEILMLALLGSSLGALGVAPLIYYLHHYPIRLGGSLAEAAEEIGLEALVVFATDFSIYRHQALAIFGLSVLLSIYPFWFVSRLSVVKAIRT